MVWSTAAWRELELGVDSSFSDRAEELLVFSLNQLGMSLSGQPWRFFLTLGKCPETSSQGMTPEQLVWYQPLL